MPLSRRVPPVVALVLALALVGCGMPGASPTPSDPPPATSAPGSGSDDDGGGEQVVSDVAPLVRLDGSSEHDAAWAELQELLAVPDEFGLPAPVVPYDNDSLRSVETAAARFAAPPDVFYTVMFVADATTFGDPSLPVLAIDPHAPDRRFCVLPAMVGSVAVNLELYNMDFEEFIAWAEIDGGCLTGE